MQDLTSYVSIPGADPTMIIIAGVVLAGAVLGALLLALDALGVNKVRLRRHGTIRPAQPAPVRDTPQQAWATATTREPAAALR